MVPIGAACFSSAGVSGGFWPSCSWLCCARRWPPPRRIGSLKIPTYAASVASAADWASTYHALKYYKVREVNPMLSPLQSSPGTLVTMGAMIDAGAFSAWNLTVGRKNPKIAAAGLWGMAIFRSYLAIHNLRNTRKAERR